MEKLTINLTTETPELSFTQVGTPGRKGDKGDKGDTGAPLRFEDLTEPQKLEIKGDKGDKGDKGGPRGFHQG